MLRRDISTCFITESNLLFLSVQVLYSEDVIQALFSACLGLGQKVKALSKFHGTSENTEFVDGIMRMTRRPTFANSR
jgi:hypothetical protein